MLHVQNLFSGFDSMEEVQSEFYYVPSLIFKINTN